MAGRFNVVARRPTGSPASIGRKVASADAGPAVRRVAAAPLPARRAAVAVREDGAPSLSGRSSDGRATAAAIRRGPTGGGADAGGCRARAAGRPAASARVAGASTCTAPRGCTPITRIARGGRAEAGGEGRRRARSPGAGTCGGAVGTDQVPEARLGPTASRSVCASILGAADGGGVIATTTAAVFAGLQGTTP